MTNRRFCAIAGVILVLAVPFVLAHSPAAPPSPHLDKLRLLPPVLVSSEKGWGLTERMRKYNVEAVSVAVFEGGRLLWAEARGLSDREAGTQATAETLFQAGSISKPVTAAAVMKEVEAGALSLDRDVNEYLKSWKLPPPVAGVAAGPPVTLARLLSHRAGLTVHGFPGYAAGEPVPTVPQVLDGATPANTEPVRIGWPTASKYEYSGGGYTIAQLVLTDTLGKPFPDLMRELVLAPAGMTHSTYEQPLPPAKLASAAAGYRADGKPIPGKRHTYPEMAAAGLWTTAEDLTRFAIAVQRSLAGEKGALLSKESAGSMTTPLGKDEPGLGLFMESHEGLTWFGHDGADEGFQALLLASREGDCRCGIAVMANSDNGVRLGREIIRGVAQAQKWKYMPAPIQVTKLPATDLARVPGRYRIHGDEAVTISLVGGRLVGDAGTPGEFELHPVSRDQFVRTDRPLRYEVERGADGGVSRLDVAEPGKTALAVATRMPEGERLPSDDLNAGRLDEALAGYRRLKAESPDDPGASAGWLNDLGYRLARSGKTKEGLAILRLATALYPGSANAWDSLAEASLEAGDNETARAASQKVLQTVDGDTTADAALKARLRALAAKRLADLMPPPKK